MTWPRRIVPGTTYLLPLGKTNTPARLPIETVLLARVYGAGRLKMHSYENKPSSPLARRAVTISQPLWPNAPAVLAQVRSGID